jgi:hypothetical protein
MVSGSKRFWGFDRTVGFAFTEFIKEYPLMSDMLIDQQEAFVIDSYDKTFVELSERLYF